MESADIAANGTKTPVISLWTELPEDGNRDINSQAGDELTSIIQSLSVTRAAKTFNPISAGSSSPPLQQWIQQDILPPIRPSSTPFHRYDHGQSEADIPDPPLSSSPWTPAYKLARSISPRVPSIDFATMPMEVHESILDHLFGSLAPIFSNNPTNLTNITRRWGTALRHSRRKELADLALVTPAWRRVVQSRLYRHIKLKATADQLRQVVAHFSQKRHLQPHVKHVEIWFPVFEPTYGSFTRAHVLSLPTINPDGFTNSSYTLPGNMCALQDVFKVINELLIETKVLTIEGGERRKSPMVMHFSKLSASSGTVPALPVLKSVRTLVTRGQWNLVRDHADFINILGAVPNLSEWHCSYSRPKSKGYISMAKYLPFLPPNITNLSVCLENDHCKEAMMPAFYCKAMQEVHVCSKMAEILPSLEHFAYNGRVCHRLFSKAMKLADSQRTKLKSIDLTVKSCCRPPKQIHDSGSGIQCMGFINAFEQLVLAAIRSLKSFEQVRFLRIRFIDLGEYQCLSCTGKEPSLTVCRIAMSPFKPILSLQ